MIKSWRSVIRFILCLACFVASAAGGLPAAQAFTSDKILLTVSDNSRQVSASDAAILVGKLATQFKFPKYELLTEKIQPTVPIGPAGLKQLAEVSGADGILVLEINKFQALVRGDLRNNELYEDTLVDMALHYYDKKTGQAGRYDLYRSLTLLAGPDSGALNIALALLEESLNKLDAVFPRQFPGPRY